MNKYQSNTNFSLFSIITENIMEKIVKKYMSQTTEHWMIPQKSFYHNAVSLITSQKIAFNKSRQIRKKLYELNNCNDEYDYNLFNTFTREQFIECGLDDNLVTCIMTITELAINDNLNINTISNIKYVGPWTIKALKILNNLDDEQFLSEDYWIRQRVARLFNMTTLSKKECDDKISNWTKKSLVSRFFWRILVSGIEKMQDGEKLTEEDFV